MPYIGLPPFLREKSMTKIFWLSRCQCPISGFPHFYSCQITDAGGEADCVNALYRASPISTNKDSARKKINIEECQCPISGFPHFYKLDGKIGIDILRLCQCPISGFPHFYCTSGRREFEVRNCVNALYRASPISTWWILVWVSRHKGVNALYRASPISTEDKFLEGQAGLHCVNALYRASPISTLHKDVVAGIAGQVCQCPISGFPHFYWQLM